MKQTVFKILPWLITVLALYFAFKGIDLEKMFSHLKQGNIPWLSLSVLLTIISYLLRAWRWQYFFPDSKLKFIHSYQVLILGFFMNNVLPARAGELIRAHLGSKISNEKRTLVLATIASERLTDGLTLSTLFMIFVLFYGTDLVNVNITYVAALFFFVAIAVMATLFFKDKLFILTDKIGGKFNNKASDYATDRIQVFINGLSPLFNIKRLPAITLFSLTVWTIELLAYYAVAQAFNSNLTLLSCIIFLVAVNFSSLVPAAPAGIGVIEAFASAALMSIGLEQELALSMVISQHLIQIIVIAIPGIFFTLTFKKYLRDYNKEQNAEQS